MLAGATMIQLILSMGFSSRRLHYPASSLMPPLHPMRDSAIKQRDPIKGRLILGQRARLTKSCKHWLVHELIDGRMSAHTSNRTILRI
jgi:hypothetical protein